MDEYHEDGWHLVCSPKAMAQFIFGKCMLIVLQTPEHLARVPAFKTRSMNESVFMCKSMIAHEQNNRQQNT